MTDKLEIITLPHPNLRQPSQRVGFINEEISSLIGKMVNQAILWEKNRDKEQTVGLAAVQLNELLKVIIVRLNYEHSDEPDFQTLINPKIDKLSGLVSAGLEGCLSVPNYYANVERHAEVKISALNEHGTPIKLKFRGFAARVIQHEIDHLKGIMIVDRAVEGTNESNEKFTFCRLNKSGQFEIAAKEELAKRGLLEND